MKYTHDKTIETYDVVTVCDNVYAQKQTPQIFYL